MEKYKKAQPIPEERLKKYRDIYYNKNMLDYMPDHVAKYYQRVVAAGIEQVSPLNRLYGAIFKGSRKFRYRHRRLPS